jgi:hypothetical protein
MANPSHVVINDQEVAALNLHSAQIAGDVLLNDCYLKLRKAPGGSTFYSDAAANTTIRAGCTADATFTAPPSSNQSSYVSGDGIPIFNVTTDSCEQVMCRAEALLCVANRLMELSDTVQPTTFEALVDQSRFAHAGQPNYTIRGTTPATITLPPADAESSATLREMAFHYAAWAAELSAENLRFGAGRTAAPWAICTAANLTGLTFGVNKTGGALRYGEVFASLMGEALTVAQDGAHGAARAIVAVADADQARIPDKTLASKLAWTVGVLSRAHAAHLLIGGPLSSGLGNYRNLGDSDTVTAATAQPFCALDPLEGKDAAALRILRVAAPNPAAIENSTLRMQAIFETASQLPSLPDGTADVTLRDRLAERWGDPSVRSMAYSQFLVQQHLSELNFIAARRYLVNEIKSFMRDKASLQSAFPLTAAVDGTQRWSTAEYFTATGLEPIPPPAIAYEVLARFPYSAWDFADGHSNATSGPVRPFPRNAQGSWFTSIPYPGSSLLALSDYTRMVSADLLSLTTGVPDPVQYALASVQGAAGGQIIGRLESCMYNNTPTGGSQRLEARIRFYGRSLIAGDYQLVSGVSGLRCATQGSVDGAPCTLAAYAIGATGIGGQVLSPLMVSSVDTAANPWVSFPSVLETKIVPPPRVALVPSSLFLIHRIPNTPVAPGNFEVVAAIRPSDAFTNAGNSLFPQMCSVQAIAPDIYNEAQTILTPTPQSCGQAAVTSVGTNNDDKIPLESELSDDGNGIESSWRVYLERARSAAARTDQLGEQLVEQGLEADRTIESAVEDLTKLCGQDVSVSDFFPANMADYRGPACARDQEGLACPAVANKPPYVCRSERCVVDPIATLESKRTTDPAAARLLKCLGASTLVNVALGSTPLCVWQNTQTFRICDEVAGRECPFAPGPGDICDETAKPPGNYLVKTIAPLGLFNAPDPSAPHNDPTEPPQCSKIRSLRQGGLSLTDRLDAIGSLNTGFFAPENLRAYATRIGWEAGPDDYSSITMDGATLFETGSLFRTPMASAGWPCGSVYGSRESPTTCPTNGATETRPSLFCSYTACVAESDRARRALMNDRMGRAVLALRLLSGAGLGPLFRGPFEPDKERMLYLTTSDEFGTPDYDGSSVEWPEGNHAGNYNGLSVTSASTFRYKVVDSDTFSDETGTWDVTGLAMCFNGGTTTMWTAYENSLAPQPRSASCSASDHWMPMFKAYPSSGGTNSGPYVGQFWTGLDGQRPPGNLSGDNGKAFQLLRDLGNENAVIFPPYSAKASELTSYWKDEPQLLLPGGLSSHLYANRLKIAQEGITKGDVLDGMELVCEAARKDTPGALASDCTPAAAPQTLGDVDSVEWYLRCAANEIREHAQNEIFMGMPSVVIDSLSPGFQLQGDLEAAAGDFASSLLSFHNQELILESVLASFAEDLKRLRLLLRTNQIALDLVNLQQLSNIATQTAACLHEMATASDPTSGSSGLAWGKYGGSAVTCANSAVQIGIAIQSASLQSENIELQGEMHWVDFQSKFRGYGESLQQAADQLTKDGAAMRAALARIQEKREEGLRNLSRAMLLGTDAAGNHFATNTVVRRRYNTLLARYQRAWSDAVQLAWIARRAIEQRLGLAFNEMHENMLLVENPASWADELATITGVDYTRIRSEGGPDADDYADQFLGDYVDKLELVVDSYEHDFPFHEGQDTAVISLRDDVSLARRTCDISVPNLLAHSGLLDVSLDPETYGIVSYQSVLDHGASPPPAGSGPTKVWSTHYQLPGSSAVDVVGLDGSQAGSLPVPDPTTTGGPVRGYKVTFNPPVGTPTTTSQLTALAQDVSLTSGFYRLSWYGRQSAADSAIPATSIAPAQAVSLRLAALPGAEVEHTTARAISDGAGSGWVRYFAIFRIDTSGTYAVAIDSDTAVLGRQRVDVGALMLENVSGLLSNVATIADVNPALAVPVQYVGTMAAGVQSGDVCEDTEGSVFRTRHWKYGCEQLCPTGYGQCDDGIEQCFWELPIDINLEGIEGGRLLAQTGFAYGNYNYRIDDIAINIVGTGVHDCSGSPLPTTCQANASLPFSLDHLGPYTVRNHRGDVYAAQLFEGRIEHGRALAAERYITNPISSADRSLIEPYVHHELRGRPLTGRYRLRIWDVDGMDFQKMQDVQLILGYRYWTRFE